MTDYDCCKNCTKNCNPTEPCSDVENECIGYWESGAYLEGE